MVWSTQTGEVLIDIVTRPGQTDHGHGGGALAYGGKPAAGGVVAPPQPRPPPAAPYAPQPYPPAQLRLHQPGYGSAALSYRDSSYVRGGGAVGSVGGVGAVGAGAAGAGEYRGGRVSLLGAAYLPPPAPAAHHPPPADPPPFKKIRLTAERTPLPHHQPLRVDTREPVNQYSTVEVLSPNPPSEPTMEDQSFRTTKDDLLQQISKVDREMALSDSTLSKLKKKQEELEQTASKPARAEEPEETVPRHRSLAQCVYAENRKKISMDNKRQMASSAHAVLSHLGPPVLYPLYNQPQDTEVYHENIRRHRTFRKRLAEHIRKLKLEAEKREDALAEAYSRRAAEWLRRVERIEQGQKRKAKDARNREFFEKVFPELRKQREERERFNRLGARVKSEAELEEIADGLHEQEHEDKKMRSLTVVPPLLRDPSDATPIYIDTNRRCMDMESEHKELQLRNVWSQAERELFREKYLQHPKNFGQIASFLPRKSVRDCVRFYYLSKKAENYKQLLRKPRQRRSARNPPRAQPEPELPAGVTTRLQRSQGTTARGSENKEQSMEEGMQQVNDPVTCIPIPTAAPAQPPRSELTRTPPLPPSPPPASSAPPAPVTSTPIPMSVANSPAAAPTPPAVDVPLPPTTVADVTLTITPVSITPQTPISAPTSVAPTSSPVTCITSTAAVAAATLTAPAMSTGSAGGSGSNSASSGSGSAPPTPQPAQPPTPTQPPPTPEAAVTERIGTPSSTTTLTTTTITTTSSNCAVCNMSGATRTVSRSRAIHYGLKEEAVGARVCEPCHCRCVRSRYTRCPVPTCPGPRVRAKRLRHLPPRWHDLSLELKRPLMEEFEIPSELSKCCLACFKRITRRLETVVEGGLAPEPTEEEAARFRSLLREHGTAWDRIAAVSGRTPASLKAFYFTYRKKLQLDTSVADRPSLPSSEDSALSSADTDTASGGSPAPPAPAPAPRTDAVAPRRPRRDEYDSSATETADEENDAPTAKVVPPTPLPTPLPLSRSPAVLSRVSPPPVTSAGRPAAAPQTVRDVVLNLIEISLTRDSQPQHPTIKPHQIKVTSSCASGREALATLSVVNSSHVGNTGAASPQRAATITPLSHSSDKDVMVLHIEPRPERPERPERLERPERHERHDNLLLRPERHEPLLDLSVKRPRHDQPFPHPNKSVYRNSTDYRPQQERESPNQYNSKPKSVGAPPRPTLKPAPNPKGSITLGTPVETRFEPHRNPPEPKTGSITAGTPVHGTHHIPDKRTLDFYKRRSPGGPQAYYAQGSQPRPQSPSFSPTGSSGYTRNPYGLEQRQIIMADFITSQQMHGGARRERERAASPQFRRDAVSVIQRHTPQHSYPHPHPHPPPDERAASPQFRRDALSVIQRHSPQHVYQHQHPQPPPGHEAFTSLVDVASAATALPVPRGSQPDGKQEAKQQQQQQQQQQHHDLRFMAQKFPIGSQFPQMIDRRVQSQPQYMERDRQIQIQRRDAERAIHAIHERHAMEQQQQQQHNQQQQQQHQQQIIHERHMQHSIHAMQERHAEQQHQQQQQQQQQQHQQQQQQHQQQQQQQQHQQQLQQQIIQERHHQHLMNVSSQEERRMISSVTYSTPSKPRAQTPHHIDNRKDARTVVSSVSVGPAVAAGVAGVAGVPSVAGVGVGGVGGVPGAAGADNRPRPAEGTLTAASLIDAIITHQISQSSDQRFPDRPDRGVTPAEREREEAAHAAAAAAAHTTSIKLGDLASNIITRDFCSPTTSIMHHNNRFSVGNSEGYVSGGTEEWKRRDAPKHAPYLEPVSPPDNHPANRNNSNRRYSCVGGVSSVGGAGAAGGAGGAGGVLTAFDYVTNRIVEVMRSDADERTKPLAFPTTAYAYPYSALNVATTPGDSSTNAPASTTVSAPCPPPPPEPAPLMSAQYEPLSDED